MADSVMPLDEGCGQGTDLVGLCEPWRMTALDDVKFGVG
jgi:hypothetical protein